MVCVTLRRVAPGRLAAVSSAVLLSAGDLGSGSVGASRPPLRLGPSRGIAFSARDRSTGGGAGEGTKLLYFVIIIFSSLR